MWDFLILVGGFVFDLIGMGFKSWAAAREKKEKFVVDQAKFREMVMTAVSDRQASLPGESAGQDRGWDAAERARREAEHRGGTP